MAIFSNPSSTTIVSIYSILETHSFEVCKQKNSTKLKSLLQLCLKNSDPQWDGAYTVIKNSFEILKKFSAVGHVLNGFPQLSRIPNYF